MSESEDRLAEIRERLTGLAEAVEKEPPPEPGDERLHRAFVERMLLDGQWLVSEVERLRDLLREIEWVDEENEDYEGTRYCPACKRREHDPACKLWLAIRSTPRSSSHERP